jgi:hypothetical protein
VCYPTIGGRGGRRPSAPSRLCGVSLFAFPTTVWLCSPCLHVGYTCFYNMIGESDLFRMSHSSPEYGGSLGFGGGSPSSASHSHTNPHSLLPPLAFSPSQFLQNSTSSSPAQAPVHDPAFMLASELERERQMRQMHQQHAFELEVQLRAQTYVLTIIQHVVQSGLHVVSGRNVRRRLTCSCTRSPSSTSMFILLLLHQIMKLRSPNGPGSPAPFETFSVFRPRQATRLPRPLPS